MAGVALAWQYRMRVSLHEDMIRGTLKRESMPTPQNYKGLEAFIVATLPSDADTNLAKKILSDPFVDELRKLPESITAATPKFTAMPNLHVSVKSNGGIVLTDDVKPSFLFLPLQSLRPSLTKSERAILEKRPPTGTIEQARLLKDQNDIIFKAVEPDVELRKDIAFTAAFAPTLEKLANISVTLDTDDQPAQVYVITKSGVNRILNANGTSTPYQFPDYTFFPSRPYFWPVFSKYNARFAERLSDIAPVRGASVGSQFTVSKPYMDLGGAGLVVTLARGIRVDDYPLAVLCIDIPVHTEGSVTDILEEKVKRFGGYSLPVECDIHEIGGSTRCHLSVPRGLAQQEKTLLGHMETKLKESLRDQRRSDITGNILVLNSSINTDTIEASLPIASKTATDDVESFLLISMDLVAYRRHTTYIGAVAISCFGIAASLMLFFWFMQSSAYGKAFDEVDRVMQHSPTPYLHLDSEDHIRWASDSFKKMIGWKSADELLARMKFADLLDRVSQRKYEEVAERRRNHDPVDSYFLTLKPVDSGLPHVRVQVFSAAIPDSEGGTQPETFGILLPPSATTVVPLDLATGRSPKE